MRCCFISGSKEAEGRLRTIGAAVAAAQRVSEETGVVWFCSSRCTLVLCHSKCAYFLIERNVSSFIYFIF